MNTTQPDTSGTPPKAADKPVMMLTRDGILGANDIVRERVDVPEWGGYVMVQALTGEERDSFEGSLVVRSGKMQKVSTANIRAKLTSKCMVDDNGVRLFSDADIPILGAKSAAALDRVYDVAARLSKISEQDVEEMAKNSESVPSGDSSAG